MKKSQWVAVWLVFTVLFIQQAMERNNHQRQQEHMMAILQLVKAQQTEIEQLQGRIKEQDEWRIFDLKALENLLKMLKASKQELADHLGTLENL